MKKIFLIGVLGFTVRDLNNFLEKEFIVKLCTDNDETIRGMFNIETPDLILIDINGLGKEHACIFEYLRENHKDIPVFTIGTDEEMYPFLRYLAEDRQFKCIIRPAHAKRVLREIKTALRIENLYDKEEGEIISVEKRKKILLVDDSAITLRSIRACLQNEYDVKLAKSGKQALKIMETEIPDLILLDYDMPEMDGKEVFELILGDELTKEVPVIFLTGIKDRKRIMPVLGMKPAGYLLKPVDNAMLFGMINKALSKDEDNAL